MIGTICTLVLAAALLTWMFLFEVRLARLLSLAEQLIDRDHGPALDDEPAVPLLPGPRTVPALEAITPEAVFVGARINDADLAHDLALIEDRFLDWRASLAEKGSKP